MKKILFSIVLVLAFTACAGTMNLTSKVKKIEIGMTKKELASILGNSYKVAGAARTPEGGTMETLRFEDSLYSYTYVFHLLDGKLVEWFKEQPIPSVGPPHNHNH